jgi:hypothetical protein
LQWSTTQTPPAHVGFAFAGAHACPHAPQLVADVDTSTHAPSQQLVALPPCALQSASPAHPFAHAAAAPVPVQTSPFAQSPFARHATHSPPGPQCGLSPAQAGVQLDEPVSVVVEVVDVDVDVGSSVTDPQP